MAKRYTDTTIWVKQRWFKKLNPIYKLAWKYITDTCDHAGILKIDFSEFIDDLGVDEFDILNFIKICNTDFDKSNGKKIERERIKLMKNNVVWITGFIRFQYENKEFKVNPSIPAVYSALTILNSYNILDEGLSKGYFTLSKDYVKGMLTTKDKDKDKDKEEEVQISVKSQNNICNEMIALFKKTHPSYFSVAETDLRASYKIAINIADQNKWDKASIVNGKKDNVLSEWGKIIDFTKTHSLYSNFSIEDLQKKWTGVIHAMNLVPKYSQPQKGNKNSFI